MLLVLAEAAAGSAEGLTVGGSVTAFTVAMALVSALFSYLTNRDRLRFDFEKSSLRASNERLAQDVEHLKSEYMEMKAESMRCHQDKIDLTARLDAERIERERQYREFQNQFNELRERAASHG